MKNVLMMPDKNHNYQGYLVYVLSVLWSVITGIVVIIGFYFFPALWERWTTFIAVSVFLASFHLVLCSLGYIRFASWSLSLMVWLYITAPCYTAGGMAAPGIISQMSAILTAGFLLGWRGGVLFGLLSMGTDFAFMYLEVTGRLPQPTVIHTPITRWVGALIPFGTIVSLQYFAMNHLRGSLASLQQEVSKRQEVEKVKDETLWRLEERVKELTTLYRVSDMLQNEDIPPHELFQKVTDTLPAGWQYPDMVAACVRVAGNEYRTPRFSYGKPALVAQAKTSNGVKVSIEVAYVDPILVGCDGGFLEEERSLIDMLVEMLRLYLERSERSKELRDYKFALDVASMVSISDPAGDFTFANRNFCDASRYQPTELVGKNHSILWSGYHAPEYFDELQVAMNSGRPFRGEFCNRAKDGSLYWVDTTVVPFLNDDGEVYQYLSINHDVTERKNAADKIARSELLLRKITSQVPGNTYMFEIYADGRSDVLFMNRGTDPFNHELSMEDIVGRSERLREIIHEDDKIKFNDAMRQGYNTRLPISLQYRVVAKGRVRWRWLQAAPDVDGDGRVIWFGATRDITPLVDYLISIEQTIFDIAHIIRRPVATMLGMTALIMDNSHSETELRACAGSLQQIAKEMDDFIHELNMAYQEKRSVNDFNIDVSTSVDKRDTLFSR